MQHRHIAPPCPLCPHPPGVVAAAVQALSTLSETEAGMEVVRQAGAAAALQSYLGGTARGADTEDAVYRSQQLLAALSGTPRVP